MPPREAKARLLTREYVADRDFMTRLSAAEREWYLLTALFADDAGFVEWSLEENAAAIYRFEAPRTRERRVAGYLEKMVETGRAELLGCGRHLLLPKVAKRPRSGGRESSVRLAHEGEMPPKKSTRSRRGVDPRVNGESTHVLSSPIQSITSPVLPGARAKESRGPGPVNLADALRGTPLGDAIAAKGGRL